MKANLMALPGLLALVLACGDARSTDRDAGAGGTGAETGAMPSEDTTAGVGDKGNQDQSGVTNTETGQSELGDSVNMTRPDQGEAVTSKGDTVGASGGTAE